MLSVEIVTKVCQPDSVENNFIAKIVDGGIMTGEFSSILQNDSGTCLVGGAAFEITERQVKQAAKASFSIIFIMTSLTVLH
jgi:hypothetical protein